MRETRKRNNDNLITGRLQVTSKGFGFVIPEGQDKTEDIFISKRDLRDAMNGDTVQVKLTDFFVAVVRKAALCLWWHENLLK
ncbi:MAG: hypothetical protein KBS34_02730 [Phascolarctobacterium sp.]|nr:hypothetical protein [Candidatus Phascolarctobacterium equi]